MKTAIIIPCYNRPEYLKKCLESICNTYLPSDTLLYITDDASSNDETIQLIKEFKKDCQIKKVFNKTNRGINLQLFDGYDYCFGNGYKFVVVLDSDAVLNNYFYDLITYTHKLFPDKTVSGFNSLTKNELGNVRHPVQHDGGWYVLKNTCGALCIGMNKSVYDKHVHQVLLTKKEKNIKQNFDTKFTSIASKNSPHVVCTVPSVAEHIGIDSTLNHSFNPDVSCDFQHYIELLGHKKMKVSVNIATYPKRYKEAEQVVNALLKIDLIDVIRVYLNEYTEAPEWCKHEKIEYVIGGENLKDTGKFFWAGSYKNEYYFTADDDLICPEKYFEKHLKKLKENPGAFITLHGKILRPQPENFRDYTKEYHYGKDLHTDAIVNFPGTGVMVFDNSRHKIPLDLFQYHGMTDLWIAYYAQLNGIRCIVRAHRFNELKYILKSTETLWNAQARMHQQHFEILSKVESWKNFTDASNTGKIKVKFVKHFQNHVPGELIYLTPEWVNLLIKRKKIVLV